MSDMDTKYIVWDTGHEEKVEIFPTIINHNDRARQLRLRDSTILAAGFFRIVVEEGKPVAKARGWSATLKTVSRYDADSYLINKMLRIGEFYEY